MAIQLQRTVSLAQQFIRNAPLTFSANVDPALSIADWVRGFILAPPFRWRWNRRTTTIAATAGKQDYTLSLPQFGWLEKATVNPNSGSTDSVRELNIALDIGEEATQNTPAQIAARLDDGQGNITFRLFPIPEQNYTVTLTYQMSAQTFQSLNDLWSPIPDYLSYLYTQGFLAKSYEYLGDERFPMAMTLFVRQVLAASEGLTESQLNIFLAERVNSAREMQSQLGNNQAGRAGRGGF